MGSGKVPESRSEYTGYGFQHELDDYINSFGGEDQYSLFFNDDFDDGSAVVEESSTSRIEAAPGLGFDFPDFLIDPRLRGEPDVPTQSVDSFIPDTFDFSTYPQFPTVPSPRPSHSDLTVKTQASESSTSSRKLLRKSKRDESTYDTSAEAKVTQYDPRLYDLAKHHSRPFRCPRPPSSRTPGYGPGHQYSSFPGVSQHDIDQFLASLNPESLNHDIEDILGIGVPEVASSQQSTTGPNILGKQEFTMRMLAPSAPLVQPSEKRKRGRPKKDEVEESYQEQASQETFQPLQPVSYTQMPIQHTMPYEKFLQPQVALRSRYPSPEYFPQSYDTLNNHLLLLPPGSNPSRISSDAVVDTDDEEEEHPAKRRKAGASGFSRSMSKKEQAYLEMDQKVKLYDHMNISELLYYPKTRPGRTPCFWIQRHPYANTRVYSDNYRTWCRYRHCKGVETSELIRTASGEMREKNYKHPRTIIAGNYQVAVDLEYVEDEVNTFRNDPHGQYEYDKRNVFDTPECFFHLRCFEQLVDFPNVVRTHLVQVDHRVLNKDKSRNKITKRKNKGGSNFAEIEWYLKEDAENWMQKVHLDWSFSPAPGSEESLEKVLLNGKKRYNDRKGMNKFGGDSGSPAPSETSTSYGRS